MRVESIEGVRLAGVSACLPPRAEDSLQRCTALFDDAARAASVVSATGIVSRRIASAGTAPVDLCVAAAERLLTRLAFDRARLGAVVCVSFTSPQTMPCAAALAQARLGIPDDVQAFDVGLACSGYVYGLYLANLLVRQTGRAVLLLDGDVQSRVLRPDDEATVPVLADAGTATLLVPDVSAPASRFAFLTRGAESAALTCPAGGPIAMDGLAVFKFVATDVARFLGDFLVATATAPSDYAAFVPHQANVYLVRRLAKTLGFGSEALWLSADVFGNSASATVPVTLAHVGGRRCADRRLLLAGFGGGLSAAACDLTLPAAAPLETFDFAD